MEMREGFGSLDLSAGIAPTNTDEPEKGDDQNGNEACVTK